MTCILLSAHKACGKKVLFNTIAKYAKKHDWKKQGQRKVVLLLLPKYRRWIAKKVTA